MVMLVYANNSMELSSAIIALHIWPYNHSMYTINANNASYAVEVLKSHTVATAAWRPFTENVSMRAHLAH